MKTYSPCPSWCLRAHKGEPSHLSAQAHVPVNVGGDHGTIDAHLVDIGGDRLEPTPVVWVGWDGLVRGNLLAPDAARAYGLHLIRLAALAEEGARP